MSELDHQVLPVGSGCGQVRLEFELPAPDHGRLEDAWDATVAAHPALRTRLRPGDGAPELVADRPRYRIERTDLSGVDARERERRLDGLRADCSAAIDPHRWPLFAVRAADLPGGRTRVLLCADAAVADGSSLRVLLREWSAAHRGGGAVGEPGLTTDDYLAAIGRPAPAGDEPARPDPWTPAGDRPTGVPRRVLLELDAERWRRVRTAARGAGTTPTALLLALCAVAVQEARRGAGRPPAALPVLLVTDGRRPVHPDVDRLVGPLESTSVVVAPPPAGTWREHLARVQEQLWWAAERGPADVPRGPVPVAFRVGSGAPVDGGWTEYVDVAASVAPVPGAALTIGVDEGGGALRIAVDHDPALVEPGLVAGVVERVAAELDLVAADGADAWSRPTAAPAAEPDGGPDGAPDGDPDGDPGGAELSTLRGAGLAGTGPDTLVELLTASFADRPDPGRPAVIAEDAVLDHRELDARTSRFAHLLHELGVTPGERVAVLLDRSAELVVALIGIVRAGAVYVPIDASAQPDRVQFLLADCGARVVVTDEARAAAGLDAGPDAGPGVASVTLCPDRPADRARLAAQPATPPAVVVGPDDPVYMIYTSGTSGRPKGCLNSQAGVVNRLRWMQETYPLDPSDRIAQKTPYSFDVSVWEFFWPVLAGCAVIVARPGGHTDPAYLAGLLRRERVTVTHFVPSMLELYLRDPAAGGADALRYVFASGEALAASTMHRFFEVLPGCGLHNLYGPTEAAIDVTSWACRPGWTEPAVPIGRPVANTAVHVVDEQLRRVPRGTPGEIVLAGVQVALGYLNRPEMTAEKFIASPWPDEPSPRLYRTGDLGTIDADGQVRYLGRIDGQFKLHGMRVEPEEIEAAVLGVPAVAAAAALPVPDERTGERILGVLCVLAEGAAPPEPAEVRRVCARVLPRALVPHRIAFAAALPLTANGKLDRRTVAELLATAPGGRRAQEAAEPAPAARPADRAPEPGAGPRSDSGTRPNNATETDARPEFDGRKKPDEWSDCAAGTAGPGPAATPGRLAEAMRAAVAELLGVRDVAADEDLLDLGATSFTMIRLAQLVRRLTGVEVPVDVLIASSTVLDLLAAVRAARPAGARSGPG